MQLRRFNARIRKQALLHRMPKGRAVAVRLGLRLVLLQAIHLAPFSFAWGKRADWRSSMGLGCLGSLAWTVQAVPLHLTIV